MSKKRSSLSAHDLRLRPALAAPPGLRRSAPDEGWWFRLDRRSFVINREVFTAKKFGGVIRLGRPVTGSPSEGDCTVAGVGAVILQMWRDTGLARCGAGDACASIRGGGLLTGSPACLACKPRRFALLQARGLLIAAQLEARPWPAGRWREFRNLLMAERARPPPCGSKDSFGTAKSWLGPGFTLPGWRSQALPGPSSGWVPPRRRVDWGNIDESCAGRAFRQAVRTAGAGTVYLTSLATGRVGAPGWLSPGGGSLAALAPKPDRFATGPSPVDIGHAEKFPGLGGLEAGSTVVVPTAKKPGGPRGTGRV